MFVDEIKIIACAGNGGDGIVSWRHEKGKALMGPAGGDGGNGGNFFIRAVSDIGRLAKYRNIKEFSAQDGSPGMRLSKKGKSGDDLFLDLPVGSVVTNLRSNKKFYLNIVGKEIKILNGGTGGYGNEHFKSSTNTTPREHTKGTAGEVAELLIELELIVDAGLVGLPNAGKTSLLNAITNSKAKVGDFQFTTLEPNLGNLYGNILADIPGLIEGAHIGRGLGDRFLKHIKSTKALIHCISLELNNPYKAYKTIRTELENFNNVFIDRPEIIVLTKTDLVDKNVLNEKVKDLSKTRRKILTVSVLDDESLKILKEEIVSFLNS